jgi:hypothetical protein
MRYNQRQRLARLERARQLLQRGGGVIHLEAGETLEQRVSRLPPVPPGVGYLVIDAPNDEDFELAKGPYA